MTGQIDINEPLPLVIINEEGVDIIGRVYAHFKGNPYIALEWLCTRHPRLDNREPLNMMNWGRGKKVLEVLEKERIGEINAKKP